MKPISSSKRFQELKKELDKKIESKTVPQPKPFIKKLGNGKLLRRAGVKKV